MSIEQAQQFFDALTLDGERTIIAAQILKEIRARLQFMLDVGLGYLTLDRMSSTLAGGEAQRIRLATQVGSGLAAAVTCSTSPPSACTSAQRPAPGTSRRSAKSATR